MRLAQAQDFDKIIEMFFLHSEYEKQMLSDTNQLAKLHQLDALPIDIFVIEYQQQIAGYFSVEKHFSTWEMAHYLHLDCLFILHEYRGLGLGTDVLNYLQQLAKRKECTRIEWQTPSDNCKAIQFYEKQKAIGQMKKRFSLSLDT